jgi:hypothetical protein
MRKPVFSAYSTWGLHDELGDRVRLSEALALRALADLGRWREAGLAEDYFHLDCFWFDPARGYRHFHPELWPQGPDRLFAEVRRLGMRPGLWYATHGGFLKPAAWEASRCADNWNHSLVDGPFADDFRASLLHAADAWGVRLFKFDFAAFHAAVPGSTRSPEETYRLGVERFTGILRELRTAHPDVHIIVHCGFARQDTGGTLGGDSTLPQAADPSLLEVVDGFFSGDPQPSDLPATVLTRAADLYQDVQVRRMLAAGFPLPRIEDHGAMCAATNTANGRGRTGLRRSHLGQLARGGRRDLFYGDPALPDAGDLACMAKARRLFRDAWDRNLETAPAGGEPGTSPWHGWITGGGLRGLAWLVNPHLEAVTVRLMLTNLGAARVLFHDGAALPPVQVQPDELTVRLLPEQAVLIGCGAYAEAAWEVGQDDTAPRPLRLEPLPLTWRTTVTGLEAELTASLPADAELLVTAQVRNAGPQAIGPGGPLRIARQHQKEGPVPPETHRRLQIRIDGLEPLAQVPAVPVWSGMSWALRRFAAPPAGTRIRIIQELEQPRRLRACAYAAWFG